MNRIDRLTATLTHLQAKRVVRAEEIGDRFEEKDHLENLKSSIAVT